MLHCNVVIALYSLCLPSRGRTRKEIADNIPVVVDAVSKTQEITLKTTNKTYTFDRVFGQEATQQHIYDEVVTPILQEMLMGCVLMSVLPQPQPDTLN